jgi:hypothetical protein
VKEEIANTEDPDEQDVLKINIWDNNYKGNHYKLKVSIPMEVEIWQTVLWAGY